MNTILYLSFSLSFHIFPPNLPAFLIKKTEYIFYLIVFKYNMNNILLLILSDYMFLYMLLISVISYLLVSYHYIKVYSPMFGNVSLGLIWDSLPSPHYSYLGFQDRCKLAKIPSSSPNLPMKSIKRYNNYYHSYVY
jgi:hypothetical protein